MKKVLSTILFGIICFALAGCGMFVSDSDVVKAVEKQGYSDVSIKASHIFFVRWRGCSNDDDAAYDLVAVNSAGHRVDVIACAGWPFKGVTVRTR